MGWEVRAALASVMLAVLTGCGASMQCKPERVEVPVAVPCLGAVPVRPSPKFGKGDYPGEKAAAQAAVLDALAWEKYADGLEAAMAGCR